MNTLNLKQLEAFCAVVEQGSFTAAADALYLAQSTVSGHVAALEKDLGASLFVRSGKRHITLTAEGRQVYAHAKTILQNCDELTRTLEEKTSRELVVAASSIPMQYILPRLLKEFTEVHPDCRIVLRDGDSESVHRDVLLGEAQVGMVGAVLNTADMAYATIGTDPLVLVAPDTEKYRALREQGVSGNELLRTERLLFREGGSGTQMAGQRFLSENGFITEELQVVARVDNSEALLRMVALDMGCAVISGLAANSKGLLAFPLVGTSTFRELYLIQPRGRKLPAMARSFCDLVIASTR